ncbi:LPXTG cell wall anchor domain-containing protein [Streptomyces sp. NPDC050085]|uniref:LPXTG cell wall anchor domain-containing protein n=1 Tax=Streptomyces sp. NPDC050085 TaxID=3365600 RepID=UPI00378D97B5
MKLRRALVTAAATAAIAPIALLSAPAAFAEEPPGTVAESTTPAATQTPAATETPEANETTETPGSNETPETPKTPETPATPKTESPGTADTKTPETPKTPPAPSDSTTPSTGASEEPGDDECKDYEDSPQTLAELRDLPSKIVAGSGWHGFTYRVTNKTDKDFTEVRAQVYAFAYAADRNLTDITDHLRLQYSDGSKWHDIDNVLEHNEDFTATGTLASGKHADVKLRIAVDAKAPAGAGAGIAFATSIDTEGVCGYYVPDDESWNFDILAAGTKTDGDVPPATPEPKPSNTPAPQSSSTPLTSGSLASTGSSSMLPTLGLFGGIAVVAGAGVVYSVRRRKVSDEA